MVPCAAMGLVLFSCFSYFRILCFRAHVCKVLPQLINPLSKKYTWRDLCKKSMHQPRQGNTCIQEYIYLFLLHWETVLLRIHRNTSLLIVFHSHFIELLMQLEGCNVIIKYLWNKYVGLSILKKISFHNYRPSDQHTYKTHRQQCIPQVPFCK